MKSMIFYVLLILACIGCESKSSKETQNNERDYYAISGIQNDSLRKIEDDVHVYANNVTVKLKIIGIRDGDSADGLYGEFPVSIRLAHIDAPEKRQAFGKAAKQKLSDLCFGKTVTIVSEGKKGTYHGGRIIAEIFLEDGTNVNKTMISEGFAWHYKKYSKDKSYDALENDARINKRGLWTDQNPVSPWNFR